MKSLPFTTNLAEDDCDLLWAGREGHSLWPGGRGYFSYNEQKRLRIYGRAADRALPDLPGGGIWGNYRSASENDTFYFPIYIVTLDEVESENHRILEIKYAFTWGIGADLRSPLRLEDRPDFLELARNIRCAFVLSSSFGGSRDRMLVRVEAFVVSGAVDLSFVRADAKERHTEWLRTIGR